MTPRPTADIDWQRLLKRMDGRPDRMQLAASAAEEHGLTHQQATAAVSRAIRGGTLDEDPTAGLFGEISLPRGGGHD